MYWKRFRIWVLGVECRVFHLCMKIYVLVNLFTTFNNLSLLSESEFSELKDSLNSIKMKLQRIDNPITYKIIGCAMEVHNFLGNGFQEVIYQRCLAIEFDKAFLEYSRELEIPLYYKNIEVGSRRSDFIVEDNVLVEIKALVKLENVHLA